MQGIVPDTVEVRPDAGNGRGKGVFAITQINEDGLILKDPPLVAIQDDSTRSDARVCGNCMRLIGGIGKQLASVIGGAGKSSSLFQGLPEQTLQLTIYSRGLSLVSLQQ